MTKTIFCSILLGTAAPFIHSSDFESQANYSVVIKDGTITGHRPPLVPLAKGKMYILIRDYTVTIDDLTFTISKGFLFDGASIPKIFWSIIGSPFDPDLMLGALIHDWLYWTRIYPKKTADICLYSVILADRVGSVKAKTIFKAVDNFGKSAYSASPNVLKGSVWMVRDDDLVQVIE